MEPLRLLLTKLISCGLHESNIKVRPLLASTVTEWWSRMRHSCKNVQLCEHLQIRQHHHLAEFDAQLFQREAQ